MGSLKGRLKDDIIPISKPKKTSNGYPKGKRMGSKGRPFERPSNVKILSIFEMDQLSDGKHAHNLGYGPCRFIIHIITTTYAATQQNQTSTLIDQPFGQSIKHMNSEKRGITLAKGRSTWWEFVKLFSEVFAEFAEGECF